jgi:hypothetical protein
MLYQHEATRTCFKIESLDLHGLQLQERQYEELLQKHDEEVQVPSAYKLTAPQSRLNRASIAP